MKSLFAAFVPALLFGLGLGLGGMTLPQKVIGFLDITGAWDPSLAFVMVGAVVVHMVSYRLIRKRPSPLLAPRFVIPTRRDLTPSLIAGSFIFGVGWGLGGFCPGPALVGTVSGNPAVLTFVASMIVGMYAHRLYEIFRSRTGSRHGN